VASNRGNLAEIEELQASFDEQNAVYQEVKSNTDKIMKELAVQEKKEVQLQEKKKHVAGQQKKLKKAVTEDGHARSSALSWVENHGETVDKTRAELDKLESKLAAEEEQFDQIRDGLKGACPALLLVELVDLIGDLD
jgi:structural maintenance of chromosome 4